MGRATLGRRCLVAANRGKHRVDWVPLASPVRTVHLLLFSLHPCLLLSPHLSIFLHSNGHFPTHPALIYLSQLIIETRFAALKGIRQRIREEVKETKSAHEFPTAVKHLARALNNQTFKAAHGCVIECVFLC